MKKLFYLVSCLIMMALTACSEEREVVSQQPAGSFLVIEVADGSGDTRASYSGLSTTFEDGDALGLYAVDASGNVMSDNVRFAKSGGSWSTAIPVPFNPDWSYYAYYPYVESPYTPNFAVSGVDNQFATFIADASNKFHLTNQSTKANYSASDLMIAQGSLSGTNTAKFMLDHKKGLIILYNGYDSDVKGYVPYTMGTKKYVLVKPNTDVQVGASTVKVNSGRYLSYVAEPAEHYLTFTAVENGTFSFSKAGLSYSLDEGVTWTALSAGSSTPTVTAGNKVMWKNNMVITPENYYGMGQFTSTGIFDVSGNIMSLRGGDDFSGITTISNDYMFERLFDADRYNTVVPVPGVISETSKISGNNCKIRVATNLILPATTLASRCYQYMFRGNTSLTAVPELPATTLATYCYYFMFNGCTGLTTAPELPATTLAYSCYGNMFNGCTGLTTAPALPATTLADYCFVRMFNGCTSLTTAPELPATTLTSDCYEYMFSGCTSLTTAPELPATTLANACYDYMFNGCTSLTTAPELPATTLANACYHYMFNGCTSLTTAPELPATTLVSACYDYMFNGCSNLSYIKAAFTTTPSSIYTSNWVSGVKATGTFVKNSAASWDVTGVHGVPSGWTVETYTP